MSKRVFVLIAVLVAASMLLALRAGAPAGRSPAPTRIGCVDVGPVDPVHIAYLLVVAGPNETLGVDSRNGIEIAIDDAGGKILNHDVKFDGEDGGCDAGPGQTAGAKLAADNTIVAVIGTSCSSEARAAEPLLSKAGFVTISPSNTAPDLTEAGNANNYPGYLRTAHNDKIQGAVAAQYAYEVLKVTKAATIHDGSLYADKLQQVFAENFKKMGGTITAQTRCRPQPDRHVLGAGRHRRRQARDDLLPDLPAGRTPDHPAGPPERPT